MLKTAFLVVSLFLMPFWFLPVSPADEAQPGPWKGHLVYFDKSKESPGHYLVVGDKKFTAQFSESLSQTVEALTKRPVVYWFEGEGCFKPEDSRPTVSLANFSLLKESKNPVEEKEAGTGQGNPEHGLFKGRLLYFDSKDSTGHYLIVEDKKFLVHFTGKLGESVNSLTDHGFVYRFEGEGSLSGSEITFENFTALEKAEDVIKNETEEFLGFPLVDDPPAREKSRYERTYFDLEEWYRTSTGVGPLYWTWRDGSHHTEPEYPDGVRYTDSDDTYTIRVPVVRPTRSLRWFRRR